MDLKNFVPSTDNVVVELKIKDKPLKNKDDTPMTITVMSPYSKQYKEAVNRLSNERIKLMKEKGEDEDRVTDYEEFALNVLVDTTVDWDITWGEDKPKFSKELAKEIYESAFWIKMLIKEAQAKLADFIVP